MRPKKDMFYKKKFAFCSILLLFFLFFEGKPLFFENFNNKKENSSFSDGEFLKYKISYGGTSKKKGILLAGYANFILKDSITIENTEVHRINGYGGTTNFFSFFMKVKHSYKSIVKKETLDPVESTMEITEGKYYNKNHTSCSICIHQKQECVIKTITKKKTEKTENEITIENKTCSSDILGTFYKLRTIEHEELIKKDTVFFSYYYNNQIFNSHFINLGEETIKTKFGKIKTIKCAPLLEKGRLFKEKYGAFVWVTADEMHIPVKLEIPILVGSVYVTLVKYENTLFNLKE